MSDKIERVEPGKFVSYTYTLRNADTGELLFEVPKQAPDVMIYGVSQDIVPGLAATLKGLAKDDKFEVTLPQEAAFGPRSEDWIRKLDLDVFRDPEGRIVEELTVGAELPMMTDQGFAIRGKILEITDDKVTMDFNHPFSGLNVEYKGKVLEVRDATPEELNHPHSCGCGCHDCGDGGCGDHNGCGDHDGCCGGCH